MKSKNFIWVLLSTKNQALKLAGYGKACIRRNVPKFQVLILSRTWDWSEFWVKMWLEWFCCDPMILVWNHQSGVSYKRQTILTMCVVVNSVRLSHSIVVISFCIKVGWSDWSTWCLWERRVFDWHSQPCFLQNACAMAFKMREESSRKRKKEWKLTC